MSERTGTPEQSVGSNWWYVVGFVAAWAPVSTILLVLYLLSFRTVGAVIVPLTYAAIVLLLALPIALYLDIRAVHRSEIDWSPNTGLYVLGATVGVVATILSFVVAVAYLYQRRRYVGTP